MKLRPRLMLFFVIMACFPALCASIFSVYYVHSISQERATQLLINRRNTASLIYEKRISSVEQVARLASSDNYILVNMGLLLYQAVSNHLQDMQDKSNMSFIFFLDPEGRILLSSKRVYFDLPEDPILPEAVLAEARSKGMSSGTISIESRSFRRVTEVDKISENRMLAVSGVAPVTHVSGSEEKLIGYILCGYVPGMPTAYGSSLSLVKEISLNTNAEVMLFDKEYIHACFFSSSDIYRRGSRSEFYTDELNRSTEPIRMILKGKAYWFTFAPISVKNSHDKLFLGVGMPAFQFGKIQNGAVFILILVLLVSLFVAVFIAFLLARDITGPILEILGGTQRVIEGNFNAPISVNSKDEIGSLANSFNTMTQRLKHRVAIDNLIARISRRFIDLSATELDQTFCDALHQVAQLVGADRCYVYFFSDDRKEIINTHEWHQPSLRPNLSFQQTAMTQLLPWYIKRIGAKDMLLIQDVTKADFDIGEEREQWIEDGIASIVCVPIYTGDVLNGFIGCDYTSLAPSLEKEIHLLRMIGEIISNTRERIRENEALVQSSLTLRKSREELRQVFNAQDSILITLDSENTIVQCNLAAESAIGKSFSEIAGTKLFDTLPFLESFEKQLADVHVTGKEVRLYKEKIVLAVTQFTEEKYTGILRDVTKDRAYYYDIIFLPLSSEIREGVLVSITDITENVMRDDQLNQMQKMELLGTLAGGLAHDFNNIIGGITATVSYLRHELLEEQPDIEELRDGVGLVEKSARRAAGMVRQIQSMSQKTEMILTPIDMTSVIKNIVKIGDHLFDKSVQIQTEFGTLHTSSVYADRTQLEQVLLNLCINAVHAMTIMRPQKESYGGTLTITLKNIVVDKLLHPEANEGLYVLVKVADTGVGMNDIIRNRIFEPFFTTKDKTRGEGQGLGLSMVYNIISQLKGFIDVKSEQGKGTSFHVYLPVYAGEDEEEYGEFFSHELLEGEGTVLFVDDETTLRHISAQILRKCGYEVLTAENGKEGLKLFKKYARDIDIVVLDTIMPKMGGEDLLPKIKEINPKVNVVLSSGFRQDTRVQKIINSVDVFLQKPYSMHELTKTVMQVLRKNGKQ